MQHPVAEVEDAKLQFARQIYERCREHHGEDHEQTRLTRDYLASFEKTSPPRPSHAPMPQAQR